MKVLLVSHAYVATPYREKLSALAARPEFMYPWSEPGRILEREAPDILHIEEEPLGLSAFRLILLNRWISKAKVILFSRENLAFRRDPLRRWFLNHNVARADDHRER